MQNTQTQARSTQTPMPQSSTGVQVHPTPTQTETPNLEQNAPDSESSDTDSDEDPSSSVNTTGFYVRFLLSNVQQNIQFMECTIELLRFLLMEHIAMPYVGRVLARPERHHQSRLPQENADEDQETHGHSDQVNEHPDEQVMRVDTEVHEELQIRDDTEEQEHENQGETLGQETQYPTINPENEQPFDDTNQRAYAQNETDSMMSFTSHSLTFHERFVQAMDDYMSCLHFQESGRVQSVPQECICVKNLKKATVSINEINPILGAFTREFLRLKRPLSITESCFANSLLDVLRLHMEESQTFFITLRNSLPEECEQYWMEYASPKDSTITQVSRQQADDTETEGTELEQTPGENQSSEDLAVAEVQDALDTGMCFPGRRNVRASILFQTKDRPNCTKNYKTSRSHSPGLLTVQCSCDAPKLLGFVIMTQPESVALALSSILTHFGVPPRAVFYDNACNLFTSVMIRVPWLLGRTRLTVDRFHYKSHKCCAYFNPDSYRQFDSLRTETAESINARIGRSLASIRYLKEENLISFLRARFALLNLGASFQQAYNRTDIEDEDLTLFLNQLMPCNCDNCNTLRNRAAIGENSTNQETQRTGNNTTTDLDENTTNEDTTRIVTE